MLVWLNKQDRETLNVILTSILDPEEYKKISSMITTKKDARRILVENAQHIKRKVFGYRDY